MKKRIYYLDILKALAVILVILTHCVEYAYNNNMTIASWASLSVYSQFYRVILFSLGRLGVPLFLLATGFLILNKKFDNAKDIKSFYKHNLFHCY